MAASNHQVPSMAVANTMVVTDLEKGEWWRRGRGRGWTFRGGEWSRRGRGTSVRSASRRRQRTPLRGGCVRATRGKTGGRAGPPRSEGGEEPWGGPRAS
jgi:hypothetical protein